VDEKGGIDFSLPVCMAYSGLSDENMRRYMKKESALFEGREREVHAVQFGATVGTYSGPDAFAIGYFHKRLASFP
jgi:fatty acid-binding protein DegV